MMGYGDVGWMGGFGGFGGPMMVLIALGVVVLFVWAVRALGERGRPDTATPVDILRGRFARGEITQEQFEVEKKTLA